MSSSSSDIVLESESFALHGQKINDQDWYEFWVRVADNKFEHIGGEDRLRFIDSMTVVLSRNCGKSLGLMKNPSYAEQVGGSHSEYLGYIVFSGYNTIYFFKQDKDTRHVVLADRSGRLLAHARFSPGLCTSWLEELQRLR